MPLPPKSERNICALKGTHSNVIYDPANFCIVGVIWDPQPSLLDLDPSFAKQSLSVCDAISPNDDVQFPRMISPGLKTSPYDGLDHVIILPDTPLEWVRKRKIERGSRIEVKRGDTLLMVGMNNTRLPRFRYGEWRIRLGRNFIIKVQPRSTPSGRERINWWWK